MLTVKQGSVEVDYMGNTIKLDEGGKEVLFTNVSPKILALKSTNFVLKLYLG